MNYYREIYYEKNPWKYGYGECQDLLAMDHEPDLIVYTPDVECYCEFPAQAERIIDDWIAENGSPSGFSERADKRVFGMA